MWENETVVLVVSLKKRIMGGSEKVRFGRIAMDNAIPSFIKAIFRSRVEEYLIEESPLTFKSTPHFDLRPEDIDNLRGQILDVFRETAFFLHDEVEEILREGLILRLDYLVQPISTMRALLFDRGMEITVSDLERRVEPFTKVLPYAELLIKECRRLGYSEIEKNEFEKLIRDMLQKEVAKEPVKTAVHDFSTLVDFLSETKGEEITRVGGDILKDFLDDRVLPTFRKALEVEMKLGKEDFDAVDLEMTMKRYLELRDTFGPSEEHRREEEPRSSAGLPVELPIVEEPAEEPKPVLEESWDLDAVLGEETPLIEPEPEKAVSAPPEEKSKIKKPMRIIRREQKEEEEEEERIEAEALESLEAELISDKNVQIDPGSRSGLKELIDEKTEKVFVKKLFGGDSESYGKLMLKLEDAESWRVAKILIDNELFKRDVDPFSREAIKLVDLVYSRYYPEEGIGGKR
jgi:hypothetical protein